MTKETKEYVPVTIPCIPAHPQVDIKLYKKHQNVLPKGLQYDPKTGYTIEEPKLREHNGTYLCVFTDNSGTKKSKLVINLLVQTKQKKKIYLEGINIKKADENDSFKLFLSQRLLCLFTIYIFWGLHDSINFELCFILWK